MAFYKNNIKYVNNEKVRLVTPISMKAMDECDRKSIDGLIRLIYISE